MSEMEFTHDAFERLLAEHKLMAARCGNCGALYLPPRPLCPACYGDEMAWTPLGGKGVLAAFTTVHIAPTEMIAAGYGRDNPYCAGIVQLEEGPSISAQILGVDAGQPEDIAIGTPLKAAFLERGEGEARRTFLAFEPV
jgi:uncharacterized OB-fold protein